MQTARNASLRVIRSVRSGLDPERFFEQGLYTRAIQPCGVGSKRFADREWCLAVHGNVDECMHVRMPTEIEDGRWSLESKHLRLRNVAVFAVLVVAQKQRVGPTIGREALMGVRCIRRCVGR